MLLTVEVTQFQVKSATEDFRNKVRIYIRANFCAYLPGFESAASIKAMPANDKVTWSCPPHPDSKEYMKQILDLEHYDIVDNSGTCSPKHLYAYVNSWVPTLSINIQCNNDAKLLTSRQDSKNITYYVTNYATKKQGKSYNLSAEHHHLLLFRLMHTINHEQELAAPMVISYLMGWQDTYHSHNYVTIFWSSFLSALLTVYPELQLAPEAGQEPR
ncbi:hypothetical protein V8B97DRAFT_2026920 [Scleroderma yunnanense]